MTTQSPTAIRLDELEASRGLPGLARLLLLAALLVAKWGVRQRTRTHLKELSPHLLEDVGLTEAQARYEANKRFWQR